MNDDMWLRLRLPDPGYPTLTGELPLDHDQLQDAIRAVGADPTRGPWHDTDWLRAIAAWQRLRVIAPRVDIDPERLVATWALSPGEWSAWSTFLARGGLIRNQRINRCAPPPCPPGAIITGPRITIRPLIDLR